MYHPTDKKCGNTPVTGGVTMIIREAFMDIRLTLVQALCIEKIRLSSSSINAYNMGNHYTWEAINENKCSY